MKFIVVKPECEIVVKFFKNKDSKKPSSIMKATVNNEIKEKIEKKLYFCYNKKSDVNIFKHYTHYTYICYKHQLEDIINYMMELNFKNKIPEKTYKNVRFFSDSMYFAELFTSRKLNIEKR